MEVNRENMQKWTDALRSGEYQQGRQNLHNPDDNTFCCLGVACDISGLGEWDEHRFMIGGMAYLGDLPVPVARWLGLPTGTALYGIDVPLDGDKPYTSAIYYNDDKGYNFAQIADAIERTYLT